METRTEVHRAGKDDFSDEDERLSPGGVGTPSVEEDIDSDKSSSNTKKRKRGSYRCSRCGMPKRGHSCPDSYESVHFAIVDAQNAGSSGQLFPSVSAISPSASAGCLGSPRLASYEDVPHDVLLLQLSSLHDENRRLNMELTRMHEWCQLQARALHALHIGDFATANRIVAGMVPGMIGNALATPGGTIMSNPTGPAMIPPAGLAHPHLALGAPGTTAPLNVIASGDSFGGSGLSTTQNFASHLPPSPGAAPHAAALPRFLAPMSSQIQQPQHQPPYGGVVMSSSVSTASSASSSTVSASSLPIGNSSKLAPSLPTVNNAVTVNRGSSASNTPSPSPPLPTVKGANANSGRDAAERPPLPKRVKLEDDSVPNSSPPPSNTPMFAPHPYMSFPVMDHPSGPNLSDASHSILNSFARPASVDTRSVDPFEYERHDLWFDTDSSTSDYSPSMDLCPLIY